MAQKKTKRNKKGDIVIAHEPFDWSNYRAWEHTYIFKYLDKKKNLFFPYFGIQRFENEKLDEARKDKKFTELTLYWMPDASPFNFYINYHNWQLSLLVKYFKEVFNNRAFEEGYIPTNKYFKVILPKDTNHAILNLLFDYDILHIKDLILEIISTAQQIYTEDVYFYDNKDFGKRIRDIKKEAKKTSEVLEKMFDESWIWEDKKKPAKLLYINFQFQDGAKRINDPWLARDIVQQFKKHLEEDLPYKDWRIEINRYPFIYDDIRAKLDFKNRLAKSLYNLLSKEKLIKVSKETPFPNKLLLCIAKIMEHCLIPIGTSGEIDSVKIKHIRNWLKRNELEEKPTYLPVKPDKKRLQKYFDKDFINLALNNKRADALLLAGYLAKRFDTLNLLNDFAHIAQCLKQGNFLISHQLLIENKNLKHPSKDYTSLRKLMLAIKNKEKLTSFKFKLENDAQEYSFNERLPLHLLEQALKNHLEDYTEEFEMDIIKGKVIRMKDGSFQTSYENRLHLPEERFAVTFVNSFYAYLLKEAPPKDKDLFPSDKYYTLIALMLQNTGFFSHQRHPEWFVIAKVKNWHQLGMLTS